jgi:pimeloyl-[acyl-carrier protein] methyl ester esterase
MIEARSPIPLVFLHGWTMEGDIFAGTIRRLGSDFACHAPDLPGHGGHASDFPLTIDGCADFVADYLRRQGLERPIIVGWSLGAMVAWTLASRRPDVALSGLATIDMSPKIVNDVNWSLGIRNFEARQNERTLLAIAGDWSAFAARVNAGMYASGSQETHPETLKIIRRQKPAAMASLWASLAQADARTILTTLACPALVMKGAKSRLYAPETASYIADHTPGAALVRFEQSGHSPHLEEPDRFAHTLRDWALGLRQKVTA